MSQATYDLKTIRFHWASAALIAALWIIGQTADMFPKGPVRSAVWSTHFTLGAILAALWIARLLWRSSGGRQLPALGSELSARLSSTVHGLLYLGIGVVIGLGVAAASAHGSVVWGWFTYPRLFDEAMVKPITETHEWAANLLLLLGLAHGLMALAHQYVLRDGALARMWPRLARG